MSNPISRRRPWAAAGGSLVVGVGLLAMGVLLARAAHGEPPAFTDLAQGATRTHVSDFAGSEPERCAHAGPGREVCTWRIEGSLVEPGGHHAAGDSVDLVCELPVHAAGDGVGSCFVRGRRESAKPALPPVGAAADDVVLERGRLDAARTLFELSRLVGTAPAECLTRYNAQLCRWPLDRALRLSALAESEGEPELRCWLPLDGRRRPVESCQVVAE